MSRGLPWFALTVHQADITSLVPGTTQTTPITRDFTGFVPEGTRFVIIRGLWRLVNGAGPTKDMFARKTGSGLTGNEARCGVRVGENDPGSWRSRQIYVELDDSLQADFWWSSTAAMEINHWRLEGYGK